LSEIGSDELPVILHPNAVRRTVLVLPSGEKLNRGYFLEERDLHERGARLDKSKAPTPLASDAALVTGEIPRRTEYEKGMPPNVHYRIVDGNLVHDQEILDDQALVVNVRDKGLIVISGCAHAGIINTARYAKEVSGEDKVFAIAGGFHLTGDYYAPILDRTVQDMGEMAPKLVLPSHCTGMRALIKIANAAPDAFIENSVGTTFVF
jgi:7,8-dihydropterin-6-yl-methyl-4-(beta-D-ribofuranosyl)aminobenzene 5'-phosphate synthase